MKICWHQEILHTKYALKKHNQICQAKPSTSLTTQSAPHFTGKQYLTHS